MRFALDGVNCPDGEGRYGGGINRRGGRRRRMNDEEIGDKEAPRRVMLRIARKENAFPVVREDVVRSHGSGRA